MTVEFMKCVEIKCVDETNKNKSEYSDSECSEKVMFSESEQRNCRRKLKKSMNRKTYISLEALRGFN